MTNRAQTWIAAGAILLLAAAVMFSLGRQTSDVDGTHASSQIKSMGPNTALPSSQPKPRSQSPNRNVATLDKDKEGSVTITAANSNSTLWDRFQALQSDSAGRTAEVVRELLDELFVCKHRPVSERAKDQSRQQWRVLRSTDSEEERVGRKRHVEILEQCEAHYAPDMYTVTSGWMEALAESGDQVARAYFLSMTGPFEWSWRLDPEKLAEYGDRVDRYYQDAIAVNPISPESFRLLSNIHNMGLLGERDRVLGLAYMLADLLHQGEPTESTREGAMWGMTEDEIVAAELLADEILDECCSN